MAAGRAARLTVGREPSPRTARPPGMSSGPAPAPGTAPAEATASARGCPICGSGELVEFAGRRDARCPVCDALERHRALAREMRDLLRGGSGRQALEAGP